ncbi:Hypothetical protein LOCK908_2808 [Lacticaseibacillus rhamnosus LOCK908]|nr:hypothetical protein LRHK_2835 [Lacticaseibacillus rhamnosus ATCC 8530]AGP75414.1 Hypothetical protein LOCK908_2808 [Lacticaseibacillus rhamnosus LOCK908]
MSNTSTLVYTIPVAVQSGTLFEYQDRKQELAERWRAQW